VTYLNQPAGSVASAGDSGYGVAYPAASQYVTAVGGTSMVQTGVGRGWTETVWGSATDGGGCAGRYEPWPPHGQLTLGLPRCRAEPVRVER
jgi:hypothetical protein